MASFSIGDLHFGQGDGEITFCGAIEMPGFIDLHFDVIKGGMDRYKTDMPFFKPGRVGPNYSEFLTFEGISVEDGRNYYMNATVAYRRACLNAINYLMPAMDWTFEQAYLFLGRGADRRSHRRGRRHPEQRGVGQHPAVDPRPRTSCPGGAGGGRELDRRVTRVRGRPRRDPTGSRPTPTVPTSAHPRSPAVPLYEYRCATVRPLRPPASHRGGECAAALPDVRRPRPARLHRAGTRDPDRPALRRRRGRPSPGGPGALR